MITLGIETSCDETACALVHNGEILSSVVSSSVHLHSEYGGIVPEIASRYHIEFISSVFNAAVEKAQVDLKQLDLIAVTYGPGLAGSLLTGICFAKSIGYALSKPILGINHLLAHLFANFISCPGKNLPEFPFIGLVISGGHTSIYLSRGSNDFNVIGRTQDDAVGEAFDKVAKLLGLGYPGGPLIEKAAGYFKGSDQIRFPRAYLGKDSLDFSFSGIKTAVLYYIRKRKVTEALLYEICYSFQEAVFDVICKKTVYAAKKHQVKSIIVGGGVACNKVFGNKMRKACENSGLKLFIPEMKYCLDNGAMIATLGEILYRKGERSGLDLIAKPNVDMKI